MKIFLGADHRGFDCKEKVKRILSRRGFTVIDLGVETDAVSFDYPKVAYKVAKRVAGTKNSRGILVCMSGIGQAMAANKVSGAYAALCYNPEAAALSRQHNNANVLVLSARFMKSGQLQKIVDVWIRAKFEGGRHSRRFRQIQGIEKGLAP